jgi:hypothetical protein
MLQHLESQDEDVMNTLCICSYDEDEHDSGALREQRHMLAPIMLVHTTTSPCPASFARAHYTRLSPLLNTLACHSCCPPPTHPPTQPPTPNPRFSSLHPVPPWLQPLCPHSPSLTHSPLPLPPAGMSLDVYNQLRAQLRQLLAEGGAGPEHQARLERVRAALFTSLVVAFPVVGGQQEHAFHDEAETEDDILCYVD